MIYDYYYIMNSVRSNNLRLEQHWFISLRDKDIDIRKFEFVAKTVSI